MRKDKEIKELLGMLAKNTSTPARPGFAEDIKQRIPEHLESHKRGRDNINIIIDLRINRLTAAAIIITLVLCVNFFGGGDSVDKSIFQEGRLFIKYCLGGVDAVQSERLAGISRYEQLVGQGLEVVYYGNNIDWEDSNAVLMHWKIADGEYKVIFSNMNEREVTAAELIKLQTQMLHKKGK